MHFVGGFEVHLEPDLEGVLKKHVSDIVRNVSIASSYMLSQQVSFGPRSGKPNWYTGRPASIWGEFPQEQTGELLYSVDFQKVTDLSYHVGFFGVDQDKLLQLEFGDPQVEGGRRPLGMHMMHSDTEDSRLAAIERVPRL